MSFVPAGFLFNVSHPCRYRKKLPLRSGDKLLDLPKTHQLNQPSMDGRSIFADVRLAWNELGIGLQVEVAGKEHPPQGHADRVRGSDGVLLWIDTRDSRASHRGSRF